MPRSRLVGQRRHLREKSKDASLLSNTACLLSVNGTITDLYTKADTTATRSSEYEPIEIGQPLTVRYLRHFLTLDVADDEDQEIMISTFVKTDESKKPAAEAVSYYDPQVRFQNGQKEIEGTGGDAFGHELIYYTKSYTGQAVKMTTKIMELDDPEKSLKEIASGFSSIGQLPFFSEYLPYMAIAQSGTALLGRIFSMLDKDDPIIPKMRLELFYDIPNTPKLQSGRIVCIQGKNERDFLDENGVSTFRLTRDNRLVDENNTEYKETSYTVLQVNAMESVDYTDFEYHQNAAELLAMTNRKDSNSLSEFIETATQGFQTYADITTIEQMKDMKYSMRDAEDVKKLDALFRSLSPVMQELFEEQYEALRSRASV